MNPFLLEIKNETIDFILTGFCRMAQIIFFSGEGGRVFNRITDIFQKLFDICVEK